MSSIQKRPDGRWRARYRDPSGKERARHFDRKIDATRFLATVESDVLRGNYVDPGDQTTVVEYARRWAASRPHRPKTARTVDSFIRIHIDGTALGRRRLASVLPSEVQGWVTDRSRVLAPSTLRALVKFLRSVFAAAVFDRLIASSPAVRLSLPPVAKERVVPLTVAQVRTVADAVAPRHRAMAIVQAALGLRIGELLGLRVGDVDFLRRTVRIEHQANERTLELVEPKTVSSYRTIPLPQVAADALAEHLREFPPSADFPCSCTERDHSEQPASGLIFHSSTGRPYAHNHYGARVFGRAVVAANAAALAACEQCDDDQWVVGPNGRRVAPVRRCEHDGQLPASTSTHALRHHYASVLLAAGENVVAVAERLGHDDATLVLTTYGHLMPNTDDRTRRAIDAAWSAGPEAPGLAIVGER